MQKDTHMKIDHLGAKNCVTGSCHLMQISGVRGRAVNILVDCGKAQGKDPELPFDDFPVPPEHIQYLFLTMPTLIISAGCLTLLMPVLMVR